MGRSGQAEDDGTWAERWGSFLAGCVVGVPLGFLLTGLMLAALSLTSWLASGSRLPLPFVLLLMVADLTLVGVRGSRWATAKRIRS
jgi:cytochrome bd-type quinol oxidase subunit 2